MKYFNLVLYYFQKLIVRDMLSKAVSIIRRSIMATTKNPSFLGLALLGVLLGCSGEKKQVDCGAEKLFENYWEFQMKTYPTRASALNYGERNNTFFENTEENYKKIHKKNKEFLQQAQKLKCSGRDQENLDIFIYSLTDKIESFKFSTYYIQFSSTGGEHTWLPQLHNRVPLKTLQNYQDYIERLNRVGEVFQQTIELSKIGVAKGFVPPKDVFKDYESSMLDLSKGDPKESPYFEPFKNLPKSFSESDQAQLSKGALEAIQKIVQPAYKRLHDFWVKEYSPKLRKTVSISDLPEGEEYYKFLVKHYTTLNKTPQEIHDLGKKEVARILGEMREIKNKVGFKGGLQDFFKHLRESPQFYPKSKEEYLKQAAYILKQMDGKLPKLFKTLPRLTYKIKPIPEFIAHKSPAAYYVHGGMDIGESGTYQLNVYKLKERPFYNLEALSYHEAVPGHHLQIALAQELENMPKFRKHEGFTAFIEGWGLYSESLGKLVGFYQDPYSDFGRLNYEQWRAMRLVVDTGIHYLDWSRKQAIDYMVQNSGLSLKNIEAEVDRYISRPGQALAYKVGQLKILELRQKAEKELKNKYDIREFHDVVLGSGAVPLKVLEKNVENYIQKNK